MPADVTVADAPSTPPLATTLSPWQRLVAVFVRPTRAWDGLRERGQWWFPMLLTVLAMALVTAAVFERSIVPMMEEQFEQQVAEGQLSPERAREISATFTGTTGVLFTVGQQVVFLPVFTLFAALIVFAAAGFMLGTKLTYRQALDVAAWSGLVTIPGYVLTALIAGLQEIPLKDVHLGLAVLLPQGDTPSRLMTGLGAFLDGLGPFSIWYLVLGILGASALSGAPRRRVAWVLSGLYVAVIVFFSALAAWFTPAG